MRRIRFGSFFVELGLFDYVKNASLDRTTAIATIDISNEHINRTHSYTIGFADLDEAEKAFMDFFNACSNQISN